MLTAPIKSDTVQTVVVVVNTLKPFTHASIPLREPLLGAAVSGFFVAYHANANGGITHPSMRLKRPIRINVANLACVSWVSIPRGRENWSQQVSSAEMLVSLDKRELLSPVDNTVDNLPTIGLVGWMSYAHKKKKDKKEYGNHEYH